MSFDDNAAERDVRMSKLRWRAKTPVLTGGTWKVPEQTVTEGRYGWLVPAVARVVVCVSVLFEAGVAVAGDGCGQNTYANVQASGGQLTVRWRS